MDKEDFKIGDRVIYNSVIPNVIKKGRECEIIATKEIPNRQLPFKDMYPKPGYDFVLMQIKNEQDSKGILPYVDAMLKEIIYKGK